MSNNKEIIYTYEQRAKTYMKDMKWLDKPSLLEPFHIETYGLKKALDVCAGTGSISKILFSLGWDVVALDISEKMLCQLPNNIKSVVSSACNIPFEDNYFEISVCRQGLQYTDVIKALNSIARVTNSSILLGHITIASKEDLEFWKYYFSIAAPGRKNVFFPGEIETCAINCGLELEKQTVIYDSASLLSPVKYLTLEKQELLYSLVLNSSQSFKKRNGITVLKNDIIYERRWEFQQYTKKH